MKLKNPMRQKIESILQLDPIIHGKFGDYPRRIWIDKRKKSYRMKIYNSVATPDQIAEIEKLPHVLKTGYSSAKCCGVLIYFDCHPKTIQL